jgi:hypothetical protein
MFLPRWHGIVIKGSQQINIALFMDLRIPDLTTFPPQQKIGTEHEILNR